MPPSDPVAPGPWRPSAFAAGLAVLAWVLLAAWRSLDERIVLRDEAYYAVLGEALADGRGYRELQSPGEPVHNGYPFLYPALLAAFRAAGLPLRWLCLPGILSGALLLWIVLRRFWDRFPAGTAIPLALLAALGSQHEHSLRLMSDVPAAALALLGLLAARRYGAEARRLHPSGLLAAAALLGAVWMRNASLAAAAGASSWLAVDAPRREGRWTKAALLGVLVLAGWLGWNAFIARRATAGFAGHVQDSFLLKDPHGDRSAMTPRDALGRLRNACLRDHPVFLARLASPALPAHPKPWTCFAFSGLVLAGLAGAALRRRGIVEHVVLVSLAMLAMNYTMADRFLIPLAPFLLAYAASALLHLARAAWSRPAVTALAWGAAVLAGLWRAGHPFENRPDFQDLVAACGWLKGQAADGEVVMSTDTACVYLYAGRKGISPSRVLPASSQLDGRFRWLLADPESRSDERLHRFVREALETRPGRLRERHRSGRCVVYEVSP